MQWDSLEVGAVVSRRLQAIGLEVVGDELCGALVGLGAGVAAFHRIVREVGGERPPGGGFGGWLGAGDCGG